MDFQYAGFGKRFIAGIVDAFVFAPLILLYVISGSLPKPAAILLNVLGIVAFSVYNVILHARFGQTLGKMAAGIRVLKTDGQQIALREALTRSSVDIVVAVILSVSNTVSILSIPNHEYSQTSAFGFSDNLANYTPIWGQWTEIFNVFWIWSEVIVVLFNRKRRAIHDFIAGTIVVVDPRPQLEDLRP